MKFMFLLMPQLSEEHSIVCNSKQLILKTVLYLCFSLFMQWLVPFMAHC